MYSADLNMGTICGTTHNQMIFSFSPDTGMDFTGNALRSSDNSVTQLIHILHFFTINNVIYNPPEEKSRGFKS
jgi:hypothetical protein